jgi:proteic killer suppression protein
MGAKTKRFVMIAKTARMRLTGLSIACCLDDLKHPPGNKLEALKGDRKGQYSIRINDQWRICFKWYGDNAYDVEIVDYH